MELILFATVALLALVYGVTIYNSLMTLRNHISEAWSDVDTELKRRYELIPNLVAAVKGYAIHEHETLERVTRLRSMCMADQGSVGHQEGSEKQLVDAVRKLLAIVEAYPKLRASKNYLELQQELVNTEYRIQAARRFYNGNVRDYNNCCEAFPSNLVAGMFGFKTHSFFNVDPAVRKTPGVKLEP